MNIYFSCSITGGRKDEDEYGEIVRYLISLGHEVPTSHLANSEVRAEEAAIDPEEVYERDIAWVRDCDVLIAETSTPSHGVGYEIAEAVNTGKPVLCCHKKGQKISKILSGNTSEKYQVIAYENMEMLLVEISQFLKEYGAAK